MGRMYTEGAGIAKNLPRAIEWYVKAASEGHVEANYALGQLFEKGGDSTGSPVSLPSNYPEARAWFERAAQKGHAESQMRFGQMLFIGQGGESDKVEGLAWISSAADLGNPHARGSLEKLSESISPIELAQIENQQKEIYTLYPDASRNALPVKREGEI